MTPAAETAAPWLTDAEQRVWRRWLEVTAALPAALHRDLHEHAGLSLPDFDVLVRLSESPEGRLRVSELADALAWERSRLSHHLRRMGARGLVEREECEDDGRGAYVVLAEAGRRAIEAAAPAHVATVRRLVLDPLRDDDLARLGAILDRIAAGLA
ncbi:MarR family transcriptional regulator [Nocardioides sp. TRM66260-LWL]|uniref:MarR family winged helix-turn-helix transcriptional regulator n=1 Tax=Nocardioides sp. TRM66260-LWL TaxID=2874478 RepID=UPI001CC5018E|nr:MarR family transcriptional regulator [Nocardioides sp. TRM66260-LWL]MBZ5732976.1 MarR family transcriptional regulator [Nocardioides sp. TRM66260-LWL]